jgi:hypothetical protein
MSAPQFSSLRYSELSVGQRFGPFSERLDHATCAALRGAVGVPADGGAAAGAGAPLGVLPMLTLRALRYALNGIIPGGVLARQHFAVIDELPLEGALEIEVWISAQQRRRSGLYTTFAFLVRHGAGAVAHAEWMIIAPPEDL